MVELLLNRTRDRPPTAEEVARDLFALGYTNAGGALGGHTRNGTFYAYVVAFCDADGLYSANALHGGQSEREWHQRDHVLTGFGMGQLEPESYWEALACAKRKELERRDLCLWMDRGQPPRFDTRFRYFKRSRRIWPTFRPTGRELSPSEFLSLVAMR